MTKGANQIVVYQPNETMRLDVRLENETVWLTQAQMCQLFQRERSVITRHVNNVFAEGEVGKESNVQILHIANSDRPVKLYSLNVVISVGYRVKSLRGTQFRIWATGVLREHLLNGYSIRAQLGHLEDKIDRRLAGHDARLSSLEGKVDFFVQTKEPPLQGVFYDGQLWDACSLVEKLIARARKSILLIDSWVGSGTLDLLAKKRNGVVAEIVASEQGCRLAVSDVTKFNAQYGGLSLRTSAAFHDRFLILDDTEIYLIGASLKDLGKKCFAFTKLDAGEIAGLKARV